MSTSASGNTSRDKDKRPLGHSDRIKVKVKAQDGSETFFRIKRNSAIRKLMDAYSENKSQDVNSIAFLYNGRRLRPEQTPNELSMKDGDEIDAMLHQIGGATACFCNTYSL